MVNQKRFWSKVNIGDPDKCWNWTASGRGQGYGAIKIDGIVYDAHRIAYIITYGDIPDGMWVLHKCNNRACCNPNHLYAGTRSDNTKDSFNDGTLSLINAKKAHGEAHGQSKLKLQQVNEIRELIKSGRTIRSVANQYGISHSQVFRIKAGREWNKD